ncbi:MAG: hypothetical protein CMH55_03270 [Myxococcales bacterium]|nr:hypothetical protein [Myxococcales bacterium]
MASRIGKSGSPWGFPTTVRDRGLRGDPRIKDPGPASFDPRTAPLPQSGVLEQIDPDQRRQRLIWELEEELPDPLVYDRILRDMLGKMGSLELEDPGLTDREREEVQRLLADEAAMVSLLQKTQAFRDEIRLRVASERPS